MKAVINKRIALFGFKKAALDHSLVVAETPGWFNAIVKKDKERNLYGVWASYDPALDTRRNNERKA
jgi:hypothetical protein